MIKYKFIKLSLKNLEILPNPNLPGVKGKVGESTSSVVVLKRGICGVVAAQRRLEEEKVAQGLLEEASRGGVIAVDRSCRRGRGNG